MNKKSIYTATNIFCSTTDGKFVSWPIWYQM